MFGSPDSDMMMFKVMMHSRLVENLLSELAPEIACKHGLTNRAHFYWQNTICRPCLLISVGNRAGKPTRVGRLWATIQFTQPGYDPVTNRFTNLFTNRFVNRFVNQFDMVTRMRYMDSKNIIWVSRDTTNYPDSKSG